MLPFTPDSLDLSVFQSQVYQVVYINSCSREELEALPFLTPDQIDSVLSRRPYYSWEDFLKRSTLPELLAYALRPFLKIDYENRYYSAFARLGSEGYVMSIKGGVGDYRVRTYVSQGRKAVAVGYYGKVHLLAGNYVLASPLGFAGYGGFYSGGWGPHYSIHSPPSLVFGAGFWNLKLDTVGVVGGITGKSGGVLLMRTWEGEVGGVGYFRYGSVVFESVLSQRGRGFGMEAYAKWLGFRLRYIRGEGFWPEARFSKGYAVWFSIPIESYLFRLYISDERKRVSVLFGKENYSLRLEYYEVPRVQIYVRNVELGMFQGGMWGGYRWRWGWIRAYSFTTSGVHIYENFSSRLITSREGFRLSLGMRWKSNLGAETYVQNDLYGAYVWALLSL